MQPCSGIWQTVSLESVPSTEHVTNVDIRAEADGSVNATIATSNGDSQTPVTLQFHDPKNNRRIVYTTLGKANRPFQFKVKRPQLWSPESPNLYDITVKVGRDEVKSYTGFRTVEHKTIKGVPRFVLNGKPVFQFGPLDQGYWPDGLYTPPSYDAMVFDLKYIKNLGMNTR